MTGIFTGVLANVEANNNRFSGLESANPSLDVLGGTFCYNQVGMDVVLPPGGTPTDAPDYFGVTCDGDPLSVCECGCPPAPTPERL